MTSITGALERNDRAADDDRGISDVEDGPPITNLEEIDHRSAEKAVTLSKESVEHVSECPSLDQS
jgi:hypothetical protein